MTSFPTQLSGFEPQRPLGRGGFGQVWLARETNFDREVAIKVGLTPLSSANARRRFERECKALGRLSSHRHVVDVYTSGFTADELPYLVMEYVDGGTLADRLGTLGEPDLIAVMNQLWDALQAAHAAGILHRDLKPENVFLRGDGEVVVGDFGIARLRELGVTTTGSVTATIAYAAPETLSGDPPSTTTDIYGIGITVITALLGRNPFRTDEDDSAAALLQRVLSQPIPELNGPASPRFARVLTDMVAKDPSDRPTASELTRRLEELTADATVGDVTTPTPHDTDAPARERALRERRVRPGLRAAGAVVIVVALVALGSVFLMGQLGNPEPTSPTSDVSPSDLASTSASAPKAPIFLPLNLGDIVASTNLPRETNALTANDGPANNTAFCEERSSIDGMEDTVAQIYEPSDSSLGVAAQRVMRFDSPENAAAHLASFVGTADSGQWQEVITDDGVPSRLSAVVSEPDEVFGDQTKQVDAVSDLPPGIQIYSRTILVRQGNDVVRIYFSHVDESAARAGANRMTSAALKVL